MSGHAKRLSAAILLATVVLGAAAPTQAQEQRGQFFLPGFGDHKKECQTHEQAAASLSKKRFTNVVAFPAYDYGKIYIFDAYRVERDGENKRWVVHYDSCRRKVKDLVLPP